MRTERRVIQIVTPAPRGSRKGNRVTARRWAQLMRQLGHRVRLSEQLDGSPCDVLVALHARKSHSSILQSIEQRPKRPVIVALTGTDLYEDIHEDAAAKQSLELATRLVVLQRMGVQELAEHLRAKTRVIYQSVRPPDPLPKPREDRFEVCVVGHLREVKDPFRAAEAARLLPDSSRIRIVQIGSALSDDMAQQALHEQAENARYQWLGELSRMEAMKRMAQCRLLVLTSRLEGGANVICEAVACGVPILSSRIAGSIGILGPDYPGFFPFGNTQKLAELLIRAEGDATFYADLKNRGAALRLLVDPQRERDSWQDLLAEVPH